jgi:phenylacetic acid degradation operon negative regulatory protein
VANRQPRQLVLALFGEHVLDDPFPVRASALLSVLDGAGITASATRAALDRLTAANILARTRSGREILFSLTPHGLAVLSEAAGRVRSPRPFDPVGEGWTLVTFSIPEEQRTLRHRLRSTLTWEGFAPLRDGLWIAPGEVNVAAAFEPLHADLPPNALMAFHARELLPITANIRSAWDIEAIRREHLAFIEAWSAIDTSTSPLSLRTMLVADWLALLRVDPRLPHQFMDDNWPATRSSETYQRCHQALAAASDAEFATLIGLAALDLRR